MVINNVPELRGCAMFRTRVIRQKVRWTRLRDFKPVETSGVTFGSLKTFILSAKLENIRIGTSLNILVTQNSKTEGESIFSCT